ncbi:MAG: DUF2007 domain-containing protein [Bacteroidales bacterium]|nr:DUF2007 domain-containing protein [Bacteroidales bacterium]MCL2738182.1 DUF2007 domain-containing protein [Bacteroidales bacterium]
MRVLIDCKNDFEAKLIVGRLENEGIKAVVLNEHVHKIWPFNSSEYFAAVQVAVNEEDYKRALFIISVDEASQE